MEQVILVNEFDEEAGTMEKMEAHRKAMLHRAFSVFIFNSSKEMLLQQRAVGKYHSGGLWTNACCSHPRPGEATLEAATRRLKEEMGFDTPLQKVFDFMYRVEFENSLTEYEFDHVFAGIYNGVVTPDAGEISSYAWWPVTKIEEMLADQPALFTEWFRIAFPRIKEWLQGNTAR